MLPTSTYDRPRDLPRLLPLTPRQLSTPTCGTYLRFLVGLRRALRAEHQRAIVNHSAYDAGRHQRLYAAYLNERANFSRSAPTQRPQHQG